jgi:nitrite reductase/ring-hydroxylating ferredoxin subunit
MADRYRLTSVEDVREDGSWAFTVRDAHGGNEEVFLVPCEDDDHAAVRAYVNRCTHEAQRLYREGVGAITRNGEVVCPKHGSLFDSCSGYCDNGDAADTTLVEVDIEIEDGQVYLTDEESRFLYEGLPDDDDDDELPDSTSHIQF